MSLRAVIFDCDGVLADTEPLHLQAFNRVLASEGIDITPAEYADEYLGLDDRAAFAHALAQHGRAGSPAAIRGLIEAKAEVFVAVLQRECRIYPGVTSFVRGLDGLDRAVASGARREEIAIVLRHAGLTDAFPVVVGTEDVSASKPDPAPFLTALAALNRRGAAIAAGECLVIEDSRLGVTAARRAGMRCLAVTTSYSANLLSDADRVVGSLADVSRADVERWFD